MDLMARGWDSKSVEEQIATAHARQGQPRPQLTPQQVETERKRDSLLLQRTRILHQIESCTDSRYRQTLENGLAYLESQLGQLGAKP